MARIGETIEHIMNTVPSSINHYSTFIARLKSIKNDIQYTAPEAMRSRWIALGSLCQQFIAPYRGESWETEIRNKIQNPTKSDSPCR